jgi:hypothetical protein
MATIETNDVASVAAEEMLDQLMPMTRARPVSVTEEGQPVGMGWLRDLPDFRDFTVEHEEVKAQLKAIGAAKAEQPATLPATVDLRQYCSPIENQGSLGSCTANAAAAQQLHRRVEALHLQGHPRPAPLDRRHGCVPALDDGRTCALRRSA